MRKSPYGPLPILGLGTLLLLGFLLATRETQDEARTAEEFVRRYADAHLRGDVDDVLALQAPASRRSVLSGAAIDESLKQAVAGQRAAEERAELEQAKQRNDPFWQAWKRAQYSSALDHGDHLHVEVRIEGAITEIVLVRDGELLKIHPEPSDFAHEDSID